MSSIELEASMSFIKEFELLRWAVGIASGIVVALAGGIVFMYRDNRSERKEWRQEMASQNEKMLVTLGKNTEAFNKVELSIQRLADVVDRQADIVDRQERTTQNLERIILERLAH